MSFKINYLHMYLVENKAFKRLVINKLLIINAVLLIKLFKKPLKLALIVLLLILRNNYNKYNLYINKSSLLTRFLKDFTSLISKIITFIKALKPSTILISHSPYLKKLIINEDLSRRFNALILVNANKFISLILFKKLVINKLLNKLIGINNENLLPYNCK
jgi:hypothetical protein